MCLGHAATGQPGSAVERPLRARESDEDPRERQRDLSRVREAFLNLGVGQSLADGEVRPMVLESWQRALSLGVDPDRAGARVEMQTQHLTMLRDAHPLSTVMHVIRRLLGDSAEDAGHLMAITDASGLLLWVEGAHHLRAEAEAMNLVEGARWSEECAGTNAMGTALAIDRPVQVFASEHFSRVVQTWTCTAAPIHDPLTGELLGVVDLTGGHHVGSPQARALVQATVAAAESELRVRALRHAARPTPDMHSQSLRADDRDARATATPRLEVLDRNDALLITSAGTIRLSHRHAELIVLIAGHPAGLSAQRLSSLLSERESPVVTIRAEVSRLRHQLPKGFFTSRPYRIAVDLDSDADDVRALLRRGSLRRALAAYPGPLLGSSTAPGIVEMREDLRAEVRRGLLQTESVNLLLAYAQTPDGWTDVELWQRCLFLLPPASARRAIVIARLQRLDAADRLESVRGLWVPGQAHATHLQPARR
jgi:hypothetical protein